MTLTLAHIQRMGTAIVGMTEHWISKTNLVLLSQLIEMLQLPQLITP